VTIKFDWKPEGMKKARHFGLVFACWKIWCLVTKRASQEQIEAVALPVISALESSPLNQLLKRTQTTGTKIWGRAGTAPDVAIIAKGEDDGASEAEKKYDVKGARAATATE